MNPYLKEGYIEYRHLGIADQIRDYEIIFTCQANHPEVQRPISMTIAILNVSFNRSRAHAYELINAWNKRSIKNKAGWTYIVV